MTNNELKKVAMNLLKINLGFTPNTLKDIDLLECGTNNNKCEYLLFRVSNNYNIEYCFDNYGFKIKKLGDVKEFKF